MSYHRFHSSFQSALLVIVAMAAIVSFRRDIIKPLSVTRVNNLEITGTTDATGVVTARAGVRLTTLTTGPIFISGVGSPNGSVTATQGSLYLRTDTAEVYQNTNGATAWSTVVSPQAAGADIIFGGGIDGDLNFDGVNPVKGTSPSSNVYTIGGDILANNMIIASGVTVITSSRMIFVQGTLSGTGKITRNGNAGVSVGAGGAAIAASVTPGAGAGTTYTPGVGCSGTIAANATAYYWCTDNSANNGGGTSNLVLNPGTAGTTCRGGGGGGSSGGSVNTQGGTVTRTGGTYPNPGYEIFSFPQLGWTGRRSISGGFGGAGIFDNQSGGGCGIGAGGGSGGGWIYLMVNDCGTGSVTVEAKGGAGGSNTQTCAVCNAGGQCACSGGGGGPGGTIFLYCGKGTLPTTDNSPGAGGLRSTGMDVCRNAACAPATGAGACCAGDGGKGGTGMKNLFSPSTGWLHIADP